MFSTSSILFSQILFSKTALRYGYKYKYYFSKNFYTIFYSISSDNVTGSLFIGNDGLLPREDKLVRQSMILEELFWSYWDQKLKLISACNHQRETSGDGTSRQVINAETDTTMHLAYAPGIATCSEALFPQLLKKIFDFCRTNVFGETQAAIMTGSLVQSLVVKNPKETLSLFFPWIYKSIKGIKRDNPEVISDEYRMDSEMYWYLVLLCDVVMAAASDIFPYFDQLMELVSIATEVKVVSGLRLATKLYTYFVATLAGTHIYRRDHRWATLGTSDRSKPAVAHWGATHTAKDLKNKIGWHVPTREEEEKVVEICEKLIEPKIARLKEMALEGIEITELKQNLAALIGFLAGIVNCFTFDHGEEIPVAPEYKSVITDPLPCINTGRDKFLAEKIGHIPRKIFEALQEILKKLESEERTSDQRTLHWLFTTMYFCFNFKSKNTQSLIHHVDHYKRLYGLYRLQKASF